MADPDSEKGGAKFTRKYTILQFFCRIHAGTHIVLHLFIMLPLLKVYKDLITAVASREGKLSWKSLNNKS